MPGPKLFEALPHTKGALNITASSMPCFGGEGGGGVVASDPQKNHTRRTRAPQTPDIFGSIFQLNYGSQGGSATPGSSGTYCYRLWTVLQREWPPTSINGIPPHCPLARSLARLQTSIFLVR